MLNTVTVRWHDDCPLHELPEHGDLIDKSELLENSKVNGMYPHWIDTMDVKRALVSENRIRAWNRRANND